MVKKGKRGRRSKGLVIREKRLNNKSRKGRYIYIKKEGKRGSYYKLRGKDNIINDLDKYLSKYEGRSKASEKNKPKSKVSKEFKKITKDKPLIENLVKRGIWTTHLKNASNTTPKDIKASFKELLRKAVMSNDEETLDLLVQDSNLAKLKHRFEYKIQIYDGTERVLAELVYVGNKDTDEIISDMKKFFNTGKQINDGSPKQIMEIKNAGYNYYHKGNGYASNFNISIIMRKGK